MLVDVKSVTARQAFSKIKGPKLATILSVQLIQVDIFFEFEILGTQMKLCCHFLIGNLVLRRKEKLLRLQNAPHALKENEQQLQKQQQHKKQYLTSHHPSSTSGERMAQLDS